MSLVLKRSDKFPVGTVVGAYAPVNNRHHEGKPSGAAVATATVDATGTLTFSTLAAGIYALWGEVAGTNANMQAGGEAFVEPGTLRQRIAAKRQALGV